MTAWRGARDDHTGKGEPDWVETLLPLLVPAMVGAAIYTKRGAIIDWLAAHHLIVGPDQQPLITLYAGYGVDLSHLLLLLLPLTAVVICSVMIVVATWRNMTLPRRPD